YYNGIPEKSMCGMILSKVTFLESQRRGSIYKK
uniref:Uncharacterized protein n=1 Tax=Macaca fascicularis TaxID=9541 RepID=A0A7N9CY75_MACFA